MTCGSFWKIDGDHQERQVLLGVIDALERVRHDHVDAPAEQELRGVLLRPALADVALDAVFLVDAVGGREIEAAMLGLRAPVGLVADLVERLRGHPRARDRDERSRAHQAEGLAAVDAIFRHAVSFHRAPKRAAETKRISSNRYAGFSAAKSRARTRCPCPRIQQYRCSGKRQGRKSRGKPTATALSARPASLRRRRGPARFQVAADQRLGADDCLGPGRMPVLRLTRRP